MSFLSLHAKLEPKQQYGDDIQIVEVEHIFNKEIKCNFCDGRAYFNPSVIHRRTKRWLLLSEPYEGHGTNPVRHKGCKFNRENFYKMVILEQDKPYVKRQKMLQQQKLRYDFSKEKRYEVPKEWFATSFYY